MSLRSGKLPVSEIFADGLSARIKAGDDLFLPVDETAFLAWSATEEGRLFVAQHDSTRSLQKDLLTGCWWSVPATPSAVGQYLSTSRVSGQPLKADYGVDLIAALEDPDEEPGETNFHAVAADLCPPPDTLALEITYGLPDLRDRLKTAAGELIGNFQLLQHQVRSASPLSD